jgi:GWxTD domain-containing protein
MRSSHRTIIFLLAGSVLLVISCAGVTSRSRDLARQHYQRGLEMYSQGEPESTVWELEQAIRIDPCLAPAHDLLGQIYMRRGDIRGRWLATRRAQRAVSLAPDSPQYRFNLAMIYRERGFGHNAKQEFRRVLEQDAGFWQAHYQIGLLHEESALKYESQKRHEKAIAALSQAARIAPGEYDVRYHLALNLGELTRWEEAAEHLEAAVEADSSRHQAHLLLGLAQHRLGMLEEAEGSYQEAIRLMPEEERVPFESLSYIATPDELEASQVAAGEVFLRRFWKERDPTPTTPVNERWLEHCRRVAYANVHFAAPKLDLPGWQTKRGEFYIRYGEPRVKWRELGEIGTGVGLIPPRWVWAYGQEGKEVSLVFADTFLNGEYNFPFPDKSWGSADFRNSPATVALRMVEADPEDYQHDYGAEPLDYAYRTVEFRGPGNMTELDVVYGVPNPNLSFTRSGQMAEAVIDRRAVLFDRDWNEVARREDRQSFRVPPTQTVNPNRMVVEKAAFQVPPGEYWLALNVRDRESERLGIVKDRLLVRDFTRDSLTISSLVLANELASESGSERFRRGKYVVVPRLSRHFQASQPLLVYYEVYGIHVDLWGRNWYQTEYTIAKVRDKRSVLSRALATLTAPFGRGKKWESVSSSLESRGSSEMEVGQLEVDMSGAAAGDYVLRLAVTDMNTGQRIEGEAEFTLVD